MKQEYLLPVSILVAGVLIAGSVLYSTGLKNQPVQNDKLAAISEAAGQELDLTKDDVVLGELTAPVTLVEYSDFQCPFCGRFFSQSEPQIREDYVKAGKVKFVYRHFAFLGPESAAAANAAECAKDEGKFWLYHDEIFKEEILDGQEYNGNLNRTTFLKLADKIGLNKNDFASCLDSNKYAKKVENDYNVAQQAGVQATPTVFVNGRKLEGALPYNQFKAAIEQELAK
ncbi:MAG: DsbA family protein [Candidatus Harrisonbacteria bacterium]|nr:DsbA family protein [Candidatus Harrisonbacteria bacterium]